MERVTSNFIKKEDLDIYVSGGVILYGSMRSLVTLRNELEKKMGKGLVYFTISGQPLYLVHLNDLSKEKQDSLRRKRLCKTGGKKNVNLRRS